MIPYSTQAWLNPHRLEIDITYVCGHNCVDCNRITGLARAGHEADMDVEQLKYALHESEQSGHLWQRIALMGGEPTLHPQLHAIVAETVAYQARSPDHVDILVVTRGVGQKVEQEIEWLREQCPSVGVRNTQKINGPTEQHFAVTLAPCDRPSWPTKHHCRGCYASGKCGFGLNYAGFYPCAPAAAIDRVFGGDWGVKVLRQVTPEHLEAILQEACPLCGVYNGIEPAIQSLAHPQVSPSWERALAKFEATGPPALTRYGPT